MTNRTLPPGEACELELDLAGMPLFRDGRPPDRSKLDQTWIELTFCVHYRDKRGFIQQVERSLSLSD